MMHALGADYLEKMEDPARYGGVRSMSDCPISWSTSDCLAYLNGASLLITLDPVFGNDVEVWA